MGSQLPFMLFHTGTGIDLLANLLLKLPMEQKNALFFLLNTTRLQRDTIIRGTVLVERPPRSVQARFYEHRETIVGFS